MRTIQLSTPKLALRAAMFIIRKVFFGKIYLDKSYGNSIHNVQIKDHTIT